MGGDEIKDIRARIDAIDSRIIQLLDERMALCRMIGEAKRRSSVPLRDPAREAEVLGRSDRYWRVFAEIIRLCTEEQGG